MYTYTQGRIPHHEDCPARSLYPWKRLGTTYALKYCGEITVLKHQYRFFLVTHSECQPLLRNDPGNDKQPQQSYFALFDVF